MTRDAYRGAHWSPFSAERTPVDLDELTVEDFDDEPDDLLAPPECGCRDCHEAHLALLREHLGPPITVVHAHPRYL